MNVYQVAKLAADAGFTGSGLVMAVAIAGAESGFNQNAIGDVNLQTNTWGPSVGLWQIRSLKGNWLASEPERDYNKLFDPEFNAKAAFKISKGGTDWSPWTTYGNLAYQKFTDVAQSATQAFSGGGFFFVLILIAAFLIIKFLK